MDNRYVVIMAGGVGSRFWPASTAEMPKQFLDILGTGKSLLRMTYERFLPVIPSENIIIITNAKYKALCQEHVPELPEENILCEPSRNNTAPCAAYAALNLKARNEDAVFLMAPSDHIILDQGAFLEKMKEAFEFVAHHDALVTLGITPTRPDTGYGYIEIDESNPIGSVQKVKLFKEKPDLETAQSYLDSGNFVWNAGIFVWKVDSLLQSFQKNSPKILDILQEDASVYGTPREQAYIDRVYPSTPTISIDFAILEKADNVYTIPSDIGWSDLGTWGSLYAYVDKDASTTVVQVGSNEHHIEAERSIIRVDDQKKVLIKGLDGYIVVSNDDALLIYPIDKEQEINYDVKKIG